MIQKGLIVSCQAEANSAFNNPHSIVNFAKEAERGGAVGVRIKGISNIKSVYNEISIPIIGLTKTHFSDGSVWITPKLTDGLKNSGTRYIATDATGRGGYDNLKSICKNNNVIGDISDISQAKKALESGCIALATSLSGYTPKCNVDMDSPNFKLLEDLIKEYPQTPIIAEGRFWERNQVKRAFDIGAHNVVVGTAITRPHLTVMRLRGY